MVEKPKTPARRPTRNSPISFIVVLMYVFALFSGAFVLRFLDQAPLTPSPAPIPLPVWLIAVPPVLALLLWIFLAARGYPPGGVMLFFGVPLLALVGLMLAYGLLTPPPAIPDGQPEEITTLPAAYYEIYTHWDQVVVFYESDGATALQIFFPPFSALGGYWAYDSARVRSEAFEDSVRLPDRDPVWSDTIYTDDRNDTSTITPSYYVELPVSDAHEHQRIEIEARMNVLYPYPIEDDQYLEEQDRLEREITLFVGSPEDRAFRLLWDEWKGANNVVTIYLPIVGGVGALALLISVRGFSAFAASGGYGAVKPGLLGKTGLVVADTALMQMRPDAPPLPAGVIVLERARPNTAGERAGIYPGDVLTEIDGQPVTSHRKANAIVRRWRKGESKNITVDRGGQPLYLRMDL